MTIKYRTTPARCHFDGLRYYGLTIATAILLTMAGGLFLWLFPSHHIAPVIWTLTLYSTLFTLGSCLAGLVYGLLATVISSVRNYRLKAIACLAEEE